MIIFSIYDKLVPVQKDYIQVIDNLDLVKREMLSKYRKMIGDKDKTAYDKFLDLKIYICGEIKDGVLTVYSKDLMKDISLTSFLGIEVKTDECKSN